MVFWYIVEVLVNHPVAVLLFVVTVCLLLRQDAAEILRQQLTSPPRIQNEETPQSEALAERLGRLETATRGWKKRIGPSDAVQFSVAGRMGLAPSPVLSSSPLVSPGTERKKRTPRATRFRSRASKLLLFCLQQN